MDAELLPHLIARADDRFDADRERRTARQAIGHRELMSMIKNAVCCCLTAESRWHATAETVAAAREWTAVLTGLQDATGLFSSSGNISSPPDSAFSLNDAAQTALLIHARPDAASLGLVDVADDLQQLLDRATPGLVAGGVHTPNHRWELAAALSRIDVLAPDPAVRQRVSAWLAEGVDIDADGLYSERSANYAAYVSNPCLLVLGDLLDRPDLIDAVHRNLHAQADLTDHLGLVETVFSRRQDQRLLDHRKDHDGFTFAAFLPQLRRFAHDGCARCRGLYRWTARLELASPTVNPALVLAELLDPAPVRTAVDRAGASTDGTGRHFSEAGVVVRRTARGMVTINAGSDVAAAGRVGSGLSCNPTFLRWQQDAVVLNSVRLSREFFGLGPFRADRLSRSGPDTYRLVEEVEAAYFQPLAAPGYDGYDLEFEGRFSAQMSFSERERTIVGLQSTVTVECTDEAIRLIVEVAGAAAPCCLELGFRPGGRVTGAEPLDEDRWLLSGNACYQVGSSAIEVSGPPPTGVGFYQPGEAYGFLGGTDAVGGPRLYLPFTAPHRVEIMVRAREDAGLSPTGNG